MAVLARTGLESIREKVEAGQRLSFDEINPVLDRVGRALVRVEFEHGQLYRNFGIESILPVFCGRHRNRAIPR